MGVKDVSARWLQSSEERGPGLRAETGRYGEKHSSEAFYALDDPLEVAVFSVLVEMAKGWTRPTRNRTILYLIYAMKLFLRLIYRINIMEYYFCTLVKKSSA